MPVPPSSARRCRLCGSTNYRRDVTRAEGGSMLSTSHYRCSGCELVFSDPRNWSGETIVQTATTSEEHGRPDEAGVAELDGSAPIGMPAGATGTAAHLGTSGAADPGQAGVRED